MTLLHFFQYALEPFAYLLYLVAILLHHRRYGWRNERWLLAYYTLSVILTTHTAHIFTARANNIWAYNLLAVVTLVCISGYFYRLLLAPQKKKTIVVLLSTFLGYAFVKNVVLRDVALFDSIGYSFVSAAVSVYVMMYFHQVLNNVTEGDIFRNFNFWLASTFLIYFMGNFIIFVSFYYLTTQVAGTSPSPETQLLTTLWGVHNLLLCVSASTMLAITLWLTQAKNEGELKAALQQ